MKTFLKFPVFVLILCMSNLIGYSQTPESTWQFGANLGVAVYQGDLTPNKLGSYKTLKPTLGFNISRILTPAFKLRTSVSIGELYGDEGLYDEPSYRKQRNLSFKTTFTDVSEMFIWNFLDKSGDEYYKTFSPYIFAGVGVSFLNVNRNSSNVSAAYLLNEPIAAMGLAQDLKTTPPKALFVLPVGFGVEYYISPTFSLNAEINFRFTQTDYLDGFSKVGNPNGNDRFYTNTIGILYKFGEQ